MKTKLKVYLIFAFFLSALMVSFFLLPTTESSNRAAEPFDLGDYDIRLDKDARGRFIERPAQAISTDREKTLEAEENLKTRNADLKIEYNDDLRIPETIATRAGFLTAPSGRKRAAILKDFIENNAGLFGLDRTEIDQLEKTADYTNPNGELSFVHFEQKINSIPVFRGEVKAVFTRKNEIVRVINNLAPNLAREALPANVGSAGQAVSQAAEHINLKASETLETTAEKIYFPIDHGIARLGWQVILWTANRAFYVIVDAETGTLLFRKNLTVYQRNAAVYNVYGNTASMMKTADSPAPFTPGCANPNSCPQPPAFPRQTFTLIGNEPPYDFNLTGWIPDGTLITSGNNAEAGIDRQSPNGIDPNGWAFGGFNRNFVYDYNPAPGIPPPGEEPLPPSQTYPPSAFQQGSVTHAFYAVNRWHDEMYRLGFTEAARNFQNDNFGRGGLGGDSISVEVQDSSGTNGANFAVPPDGSARPRLQLFIWTAGTPDRDGALDSQVIVHELTHGLSGRLHGNGSGLGGHGGMMGEGWSDFYALSLLSEPTDDPNGTYSIACYSSEALANCYYGIRRFPYARIAAVGPNGLPHNPLTFGYLNAGCDVLIGTTTSNPNSAYPRNPAIATSGNCAQVHNGGEIWAVALWEVRAKFIDRLGWTEGNRRALQFITDGMKLAPINPTMLQERDAIIAAANAGGTTADVRDIWAGFALRGMGFSASVQSISSVTEAFDQPNVVQTPNFTFTEIAGNMNGYPEPGETLRLSIPLTNNTGATITDVGLLVTGGGSAFYGDIAPGETVTRQVNFTVPTTVNCPGYLPLVFTINSSAGQRVENRSIFVGAPIGAPSTFTNSTPMTIPAGAPTNTMGAAEPYPSEITTSGLSGNGWRIKIELTALTHTFPGDIDILLVGPGGQKFIVMSDLGGGADVSNINLTLHDLAANSLPAENLIGGEYRPGNAGVGDTFPAPAPAAPYMSPAPDGNATLETAFGTNGANLNGVWKLYVVDDANTDSGSLGGWKLTFQQYLCVLCRANAVCPPLSDSRADFDGDGKSDVSVFRPSDGVWYLNRSLNGFTAFKWGISTDTPTPGDFDGDGKTDAAVFRPMADASLHDFYILKSSDFTFAFVSWGLPGDVPVIEDYDGDNKDDLAVYRPSNQTWYVLRSATGSLQTFSNLPGGITPIAADFDGDGKGDFARFIGGEWYIAQSGSNYQLTIIGLGGPNDKLVPADYDGDGKDDAAVFRPSNANWIIRQSSGGTVTSAFGISTDIPVPGDYDGDGKDDIAVYRDGTWWINRSTAGLLTTQFGLSGDVPIPKQYLP